MTARGLGGRSGARSFPPPGKDPTRHRFRRIVLGALALIGAAGLAAGPASALPPGAVPDGRPGVRPHVTHAAAHAANLPYQGGAVLHSNRTHLVFWLPAGAGLSFDPGYTALFERFVAGVAHDSHTQSNVYSLTGQYGDERGPAAYSSRYAGAILDTHPLPPRDPLCQEPPAPPVGEGPGWGDCVTDDQIQTELSRVAAAHHIPAALGDIVFLITPAGLGDCVTASLPASCSLGGPDNNGYCAYHSGVSGSQLLYAVIPYNAVSGHCQGDSPRPNGSTADPGLSSLSHEHNETITDPLSSGWIDGQGNENGDLCIDMTAHPPAVLGTTAVGRYDQVIGGGRYWLQAEWSNADRGCVTRARTDALRVALPRTVTAGQPAVLQAAGRAPQGRLVGVHWTFGDRTSGHGFRATHRYRRPGRYALVARATDTWGNWVFARRTVRVLPAHTGRR